MYEGGKRRDGCYGEITNGFLCRNANKQNKAGGSRCYNSKLSSGHMAIVAVFLILLDKRSAQSSRLL